MQLCALPAVMLACQMAGVQLTAACNKRRHEARTSAVHDQLQLIIMYSVTYPMSHRVRPSVDSMSYSWQGLRLSMLASAAPCCTWSLTNVSSCCLCCGRHMPHAGFNLSRLQTLFLCSSSYGTDLGAYVAECHACQNWQDGLSVCGLVLAHGGTAD
jgi:hypothetical protein